MDTQPCPPGFARILHFGFRPVRLPRLCRMKCPACLVLERRLFVSGKKLLPALGGVQFGSPLELAFRALRQREPFLGLGPAPRRMLRQILPPACWCAGLLRGKP